MALDGIGVLLVRPDKYSDIATFVSNVNSNITTNRAGFVNPITNPTDVWYFYLEFEEKKKTLRSDYSRTVNPNGGVTLISTKKYDRPLILSKGFIGSYLKDTYAQYFEQALEYATINWAKDFSTKWSYLVRLDGLGIFVGSKIYSVKNTGYIYFQGTIDGYTMTEDSTNNLFIDQFQMSWGE